MLADSEERKFQPRMLTLVLPPTQEVWTEGNQHSGYKDDVHWPHLAVKGQDPHSLKLCCSSEINTGKFHSWEQRLLLDQPPLR